MLTLAWHFFLILPMEKRACEAQRSQGPGTSGVRKRKASKGALEQSSNDSNGTLDLSGRQSANGTSQERFQRRTHCSNGGGRNVYTLILVIILSFSTRLYKILEPPHIWWVDIFCTVRDLNESQCSLEWTMHNLPVSVFRLAGMKRTLGKWGAITSTELSSLTFTLLLAK